VVYRQYQLKLEDQGKMWATVWTNTWTGKLRTRLRYRHLLRLTHFPHFFPLSPLQNDHFQISRLVLLYQAADQHVEITVKQPSSQTKLLLVHLLKEPQTVSGMAGKQCLLVRSQCISELPQRGQYLQRLLHIRVLRQLVYLDISLQLPSSQTHSLNHAI